MIGSVYLIKRVPKYQIITVFIMKNTLNILRVSSVLMALTLCISVSYPLFANATSTITTGGDGTSGGVLNPTDLISPLTGDSGTAAVPNPTDLIPPPTGDSGTAAVPNPTDVTPPPTGDSGTAAVPNPTDVTPPPTGDSGTAAVPNPT